MKANQVRDDMLGFLGLTVTTDPITQEQIIQWDREVFTTNVMGSLYEFKNWFADLSPVTNGIITIAGLVTTVFTLGNIATKITTALPALSNALGVVKTGFEVLTGPVGLVIAALAVLLTFSEDFRSAFVGLFSQVGSSIMEWGGILGGVFSQVGADIVLMWDTHILPTIQAIGSALAPVLQTLGALWSNLSVIISDIFLKIGTLWSTVLKPVIEGALEIIQSLANKFQTLWSEYVGPVIEYIGNGLQELWTNSFSPVLDNIISLLGEFWEMIMALWNNVLSPIIDWMISTFGPVFKNVFKGIWDFIKPIIANIIDAVGGVVDFFRGVIKFLTGVFTGDWGKAWEGIKQIFKGIWDTFVNIVKVPINLIIGIINGLISAVESGLNWIIGGINKISFSVPDWVPGIGGMTFGFNLGYVNWGRIPYLASGGIVTGPTPAMIGEGKYDELVMPLGDSPQMNDFIDRIVDALDRGDPNPQPVEVKVYIGDNEYDAYTYKASERGKKIVGRQPVKIGG
jgi:phage-related protein